MQHYFIGVKIPVNLAHQLVDIRKEWHLEQSHKRLPPAVDLHITFLYLGAIDSILLKQLLSYLSSLSNTIHPIDITLNGVSTFGNVTTPRVVYTTIEKNENLQILQRGILAKCLALSLPVDQKPFVPHITLAKKWSGQQKVFSKEMLIEKMFFSINNFSVYSINPGEIPSYQTIHTIYLKDKTK